MGIVTSQEIITDYDQVTNNMKLKFWEDPDYLKHCSNCQNENTGTYNIQTTIPFLQKYFKLIELNMGHKLTILDVGSGNGYNTNLLATTFTDIKFIATDMQKFEPSYYPIEKILSHNAVNKYGALVDIIMLISPPCTGFMDYYAIKHYENISSKKEKYLIIIGELGASDGSEGMYDYLVHKNSWNLINRDIFYEYIDMFGNEMIKEVFLFKLN